MTTPSFKLSTAPVAHAALLIKKPVAAVFEAMVNPDITSQFWFTEGSGRLATGKNITWVWGMFDDVKSEITGVVTVPDTSITFTWPGPGAMTNVEITFEPRGDAATFVNVREKGWGMDDENVIKYVAGQVEGWSLVLTGLKAFLEYGIRLNLVNARHPDTTREVTLS